MSKWELDGLTYSYIPIKPILAPSYRFIMKLFLLFLLRQVELVRLVEYLADLIDFQESGASRIAKSEAAAKVRNLVVERNVTLLTKHAQGCNKHVFSRSLLLLMDRNYAIAKIEPTLGLLLIAYCEYRIRSSECSKMTYCLTCKRISYDTSHTNTTSGIDSSMSKKFAASNFRSSALPTLP